MQWERLSDSAAWLAAIVENSDDAIFGTDLRGIVTSWNPAAERMFGYRAAEVIGQPNTLTIPEDRRREEDEVLERARRGERTQSLETVRRAKNGRLVDVSLAVSPVRDAKGDVVGASRIARDISARKRAAEALRQSEATAQALIESAAEGILIVDDRGRIVLANGMIEEMFGYSERELLGESMERLLPERFRDRHAAHRAGYVAGPRVRAMGQGLDLAARRRDGKEFPVEISLSYVRTPQGMRVMAFVTDITHRLALDQATRQSEKLTALGTLAAGLAHELNNPLGIMISRIELMLLENDQGQLSDAVREDLDVLHRHAQRVSRLVHGLLSFARPSAPERRPIDLNHVVDEILLLAEKQLSRTGIRTTAALDRGLPPVLGDFGALQQVVLNLVTNAYQAMENGGDIRIVTRPAPDMSGWVELLVEDTGPGIPPDVVSKIFDPFYTTKPEGTGLGLSITYRIVHDHDGAVHVDSTPGEGTTFRLRFPAAKPEA